MNAVYAHTPLALSIFFSVPRLPKLSSHHVIGIFASLTLQCDEQVDTGRSCSWPCCGRAVAVLQTPSKSVDTGNAFGFNR